MSHTPAAQAPLAAALGITLTVFDAAGVNATRAAVAGAVPGVPTLRVHAKLDSGMGRLGAPPPAVGALAAALAQAAPAVELEGVYTHYSRADDNAEWTGQQHATFQALAKRWFPDVRRAHTCNSAALLAFPEYCGDIARVGIALYGGVASALVPPLPGAGYALSWSSRVMQVKTLPAGHAVGYGNTYVASTPEVVATLPVGYSNGLRRGPTNQGYVLLHGTKCPIRGRVSMEKLVVGVQHLVDAGVAVQPGDVALLLGRQDALGGVAGVAAGGDASSDTDGFVQVTPGDAAAAIGTIDYEVFTGLLPRAPRWGAEGPCTVTYTWPQEAL